MGEIVPLEGEGIESSSGQSIKHSSAKCTEGNAGGEGGGVLRGRIESFHSPRHDASHDPLITRNFLSLLLSG